MTLPGEVHGVLKDTTPDNLIWHTVITREEIESHLLEFNRESFRAAAESPCGHGVIHDALTFSSLSEESKELFRGVVPSTWVGDDKLLQEFLASFQYRRRYWMPNLSILNSRVKISRMVSRHGRNQQQHRLQDAIWDIIRPSSKTLVYLKVSLLS